MSGMEFNTDTLSLAFSLATGSGRSEEREVRGDSLPATLLPSGEM